MDLNAVDGIGVERGNQFLHRFGPAGKVTLQIGARRAAVFRQPGGQRNVEEIVEAVVGDGHQ
ncbi:hypothetical protein D3C73_1282070 [compost metagenome]